MSSPSILELLAYLNGSPKTAYHRALEEVKTNPGKVIARAKQGDLFACSALRDVVGNMTLPSDALPEAMEMFASAVEQSCPPEKVDMVKFQLAEISFCGISWAFVMLFCQMEDPPVGIVLKAWPSILDWATARFIRGVRARERLLSRPGEEWAQIAMFLDGITQMRQCKELQEAGADPRVLELAMLLFLSKDHNSVHFRCICMTYFNLYIERSILRGSGGVISIKSLWKKSLDELVTAAGGEPATLLKPILDVESEGDEQSPISALHVCNEILGRFIGVIGHPLAVCLERIGLSAMSKGLRILTESPSDEQEEDRFGDAFGLCICIFAFFSDPHGGKEWIQEALQHRIFPTFADSCSQLAKAPDVRLPVMTSLFSPNLAAHLADPMVLFACENALSALSAEQHEQIMGSVFAPAWKSLIDRFFDLFVFYCYFEITVYEKGCYKCGKAEGGDKVALKRCLPCRNVEYCSKECQMLDWKDHKKECKSLKDRKAGPLPRWAIPLYKRRLASFDARRHLPGIRERVAQKFPYFPLQSALISMHYGYFPPRLIVTVAAESPVLHERLIEEFRDPLLRNACFDDIRLHDGSSCICCIINERDPEDPLHFQRFYWSPPYFASNYGSLCPYVYMRSSSVIPYQDENLRDVATCWSVVDEIAFRGEMSPQTILMGKLGGIRRKVLEVIVREKGRMQAWPY